MISKTIKTNGDIRSSQQPLKPLLPRGSLSILDWPTDIQDCIALIVRRDLSEQAEIQHLLNQLRNRAMAMARVNEELCMLM